MSDVKRHNGIEQDAGGAFVYFDTYDRDIKALRKCGRYWRHMTWLYRERLWCEEAKTIEQAKMIRQLREALANFGTHDRDCLLSQRHADRPTENGGYETKFGDQWYLQGEWPKCTCGLDAALIAEEGK